MVCGYFILPEICKPCLFLSRFQFAQLIVPYQKWTKRPLDIDEILSRKTKENVVVDAYEYFMRKCDYDCTIIKNQIVQNFLLCVLFDGEVGNGGISQFLSNSSGDMSAETINALNQTGAVEAGAILQKACQLFPDSIVPKDRSERNNIMSEFDDITQNSFDEIDQIIGNTNMHEKLYVYLFTNKAVFLSCK